MKYQLVIQFLDTSNGGFEWLVDFEEKLEQRLVLNEEVDGHDIGSGQMNIFILTNDPFRTLEGIKSILTKEVYALEQLKAAYRGIGSNEFICLWPRDLGQFVVL